MDRREFLQRTAVGAAALTVVGTRWPTSAQTGMFISLPPWAVARGVGWPEQARLAARIGYRGIDWAWGPARKAGVDDTRALLAELKIQPTIVNLPIANPQTGDDAAFKTALTQLEDDAAFCAAIGCRRFQLVLRATTPGGQSKEEFWNLLRGRLAAISGVLAKHQVRLGLEFLGPMQFRAGRAGGPPPVPFVWTLAETVKLCEASGPNIGVTLDAWHWHHSGGTVQDILSSDKSRIVHVHVSDARTMPPEEVRDDMRWLTGEGVIDLVGFFQALRKIGYEGGVAPETIGGRIPADMPPEESARLALEMTTATMKKAGVL